MARMAAWAGVAVGAIYLLFIGGAWWGIYSSPLRVLSLAMAALAVGAWTAVAWRRAGWRPRSALLPGLLACLAALAISTALSRYPRISLEYLGYAVLLVALYLLLVRLMAVDFFRRRLATLASLVFVVLVAAFVIRIGGHWLRWWDLLGHLAVPPLRPSFEGLTYLNPSAVLTMAALLAVPTAATFGGASRRGVAALVAIGGAVALVALLSGSRSGWLALGATALAAGATVLLRTDGRSAARSAVRAILASRFGRAVTAAGVAAGLLVAIVLVPAVAARLSEGGVELRQTYVVTAVRMFGESPLVGTGPGTWVIQRPQYTDASEDDYYIPHAHNLEAQSLAELGIVGLVAGAVLVVGVLRLLVEGMRDADTGRRRWAWLTAVGLLYFALHQLLDFYLNMPAFLFAAALPVAYLDATSPRAASDSRWVALPGWAIVVAGVVVSIAVAGLVWQEGPARRLEIAVEAANRGDWSAAAAPALAAAAEDPDVGSYQLMAGLAAARTGDHELAVAHFERLTKANDLPEAWLDLAAELVQVGRTDEAKGALRSAARLGIQRPAVAVPAGELALRLGDPTLADELFAAALRFSPSLAADPWWQLEPTRADAHDRAVALAIASAAPWVGWEIALMAGDVEDARSRALTLGSLHESLTEAWLGGASAIETVITHCQAHSLDLGTQGWCARLESRRGNTTRAAEIRELANMVVGGAFELGAEVRVAEATDGADPLFGRPADFWGTYTYRRPTARDILVPSLVHLTLE